MVFLYHMIKLLLMLCIHLVRLFNGTGSQEAVYSAVAVQFCLHLREKLLTKMS